MKITVDEPTGAAPVNGKTMKVGQLGEVLYSGEKHVVLRAYDVLISLTSPRLTWSNASGMESKSVRLLEPGAIVTLTQDGVPATPLVKDGAPLPINDRTAAFSPEHESRARIDSILFDKDRAEVRRFIRLEEIINAIKFVREKTSEGLKEAKDYVENEKNNIS